MARGAEEAWRDQRIDFAAAERAGSTVVFPPLGAGASGGSIPRLDIDRRHRRNGRPYPASFARACLPLPPTLADRCRHLRRDIGQPYRSRVPGALDRLLVSTPE